MFPRQQGITAVMKRCSLYGPCRDVIYRARTLRVAGGDEKGSLKSETVKYGYESKGTRTQERLRWRVPAAYTKDSLVLSSERAPHKNRTVIVRD
jgi:hypothetical protein